MPDTDRNRPAKELLRIRQAVAKNYSIILIGLTVVAGIGGWAGYTAYLDPGVETEERTVSSWSRTATFSHGAEVTRPNPVYSTGRRLTNQQAYFPQISPVLEGEYQISYTASSGGSVDIVTETRLVIRGGEDGIDFWQSTQILESSQSADMKPGRVVISRYRFDMSQVQARLDRVSDTLGQTPGRIEVVVQAETRLTGQINGRPVDRRFVDNLRLIPDGDGFRVSDPGQLRNSSTQTQTVQREREYSLLWKGGAPLLIIVGFGGTGGLVYWRREGNLALTAEERERLTRNEYNEWVSHGTLPESFDLDDETVELDSLGDLVDIAADTNDRVLFDSEHDCYAVLDGRYNYVYWPASEANTEATESSTQSETADQRETDGEKESPDQML